MAISTSHPRPWIRLLFLPLATLLVWSLAWPFSGPLAQAQEFRSLAGNFLVATQELEDPNFAATLVLLAEHSEQGALGLVLNRPIGQISIDQLAQTMGLTGVPPGERAPAGAGGPVELESLFALHGNDLEVSRGLVISDQLALSPGIEVVAHLADGGERPKNLLFLFGYSGWGPGQLEWEMTQGSWHHLPADLSVVFDPAKLDALVARLNTENIEL
ncbi:MAG: YqgE/AlgH family protein [Pseudomonadota bacterium]